MGTSPVESTGNSGLGAAGIDPDNAPGNSAPRGEDDLDPDAEDFDPDAGESDLDPDDDAVDPDDMNIPPARQEG